LDPPPSRIRFEIQDKKGAENVVTDRPSRIPNAPSNELPINDNFPDEQLLATFRELWFAYIVNYIVTSQTPSHWSNKKYTDFCLKPGISFRRNHISSNTVPTKSLGDVSPMSKLGVSFYFVTSLHTVDTLIPSKLQKKYYKVSSIGPHCLKMPLIFARHALDVKWWVGF